jgi:hypothetical protein
MLHILHPRDYLHLLHCPCSASAALSLQGDSAICSRCHRRFPIRERCILDLVDVATLDAETARELKGNTHRATPEQLAAWVAAEQSSGWTGYYAHSRKHSMELLARRLRDAGIDTLFSLGSGTGREIFYLQQFMHLKRVYCSDLSATALEVIPRRLAPFEIEVGLFAADLVQAPIAVKDIPILVVNALHHTRDMHATLTVLLQKGYCDIFLVEPASNFLIRTLARLGLAQRVEYSGVKPGRLEIPRLRAFCREHGYRVSLATLWMFPQDYFERIFGASPRVQQVLIGGLTVFSRAANWIHFGNTTVAHLRRADAGGGAIPEDGLSDARAARSAADLQRSIRTSQYVQ